MPRTAFRGTLSLLYRSYFVRIGIFIIGIAVVSLIAITTYNLLKPDTNPLPKDIRSRLRFSPLIIPLDTQYYTSDSYTYSKAEDSVDILSYVVHFDNSQITISEYVQPSQFSDIPEYQSQFLTNVIKQYDTVQTSNGQIYLGRLTDKKQLGIMIEKGLVVFMTPSGDLDTAIWRHFGEQLEIYKKI